VEPSTPGDWSRPSNRRASSRTPSGSGGWVDPDTSPVTVIKFELLADLEDQPGRSTVGFQQSQRLGAINLRGTGFAARDLGAHTFSAPIDGLANEVDVKVTGLAGFLLAKTAAAQSRRKTKDWYDIAFVLLHNDQGGPTQACNAVRAAFGDELVGGIRTALDDLRANFHPDAQGPRAFAEQMTLDHPELDSKTLQADAHLAVEEFHGVLFQAPP